MEWSTPEQKRKKFFSRVIRVMFRKLETIGTYAVDAGVTGLLAVSSLVGDFGVKRMEGLINYRWVTGF
jgi:hypothetical protein